MREDGDGFKICLWLLPVKCVNSLDSEHTSRDEHVWGASSARILTVTAGTCRMEDIFDQVAPA